MTINDLIDWAKKKGCEIRPLEEPKGVVIKIYNPENGREKNIFPPFKKPLRPATIFKICVHLGIEIPNEAKEK